MGQLEVNLREIKAEFCSFEDPLLRYSFLVELSGYLPLPEDGLVREQNRFVLCESPTWVELTFDERGVCIMRSWSETAVVRGILYVLSELFSGMGAGEVAVSDISPSDLFGCEEFLTERREQGMRGLISLVKVRAREWCHAHQAGVSGPSCRPVIRQVLRKTLRQGFELNRFKHRSNCMGLSSGRGMQATWGL